MRIGRIPYLVYRCLIIHVWKTIIDDNAFMSCNTTEMYIGTRRFSGIFLVCFKFLTFLSRKEMEKAMDLF